MTTRNLKAMGAALCAAFALSATAAASASAAVDRVVTGNGGTVHLTAKADPTGGTQDLTLVTGQDPHLLCNAVNVQGTTENGDTSVTVEPTYSECGIYESGEKLANATIDTEGCHYNFSGETTTGNLTENGEHANVELLNGATEGKPTCEAIKFTVSAFQVDCVDVQLQTIEHAVRYKNITDETSGKEALTVEFTAHEIESTTHNNSLICPTETGGDVTHTDGGLTGDLILTAYDDPAHTEPVDLTVE